MFLQLRNTEKCRFGVVVCHVLSRDELQALAEPRYTSISVPRRVSSRKLASIYVGKKNRSRPVRMQPITHGDSPLRQGGNGQKAQAMVPIMPRTVVKEAGWSRSQCVAESGFPITINDKINVVPRSKLHDPTKEERYVFKRCVSRLPPANAASDGSKPFRIPFCYPPPLHNDNRIADRI